MTKGPEWVSLMHGVLAPHQNLRVTQAETEAPKPSGLPLSTYPVKFIRI